MLRGSSARTGQYYKNEYRAPTTSRAYANQRSQPRRSKYERQEDIPLDDWRRIHDEAYSAQAVSTRRLTNTKVSAGRGSEDEILPPTKGIQVLKTTEVTVL